MKGLLSRFKNNIINNNIIEKNDKIIIGLSGGVDSVGLFLLLNDIKDEFNLELSCVYVNHLIRKTVQKDIELVKKLSNKYEINLDIYEYDIPKLSKEERTSVEETGRKYRRQAYEDALNKYNFNKIALAHHMDDNSETFLMNLFRGSNLKGLSGIKEVSGDYIRPLLIFQKEEIISYVLQKKEDYIIDETNSENVYKRNYIRNVIMSDIEKNINNRASVHIASAAKVVNDIYDFANEYLETKVIPKYLKVNNDKVLIDLDIKNTESKIIVQMLIEKAIQISSNKKKDITKIHIEDVYNLFGKTCSKKINLPYNITAKKEYSYISFYKDNSADETIKKYDINDILFTELKDKEEIQSDIYLKNNKFKKYFNYDIINGNLNIRNKLPGDKICISDNKYQKLSDYFINEKIDIDKRKNILLLTDDKEIIWIIGYRISSKYKVSKNTKKILIASLKER